MKPIPFLNFAPMHEAIKAEMQDAFESVYDSNWFIMGKKLKIFERSYAQFNKVKHAIGVSNGLDALVLSLRVLGIGKGDEVIIPAHTFIASALAVSYVGAKPVLVEPNPRTYNLDVLAAEQAITSNTKAIMPVHIYGQACEMDRIMQIAQKNDLFVIEDNAQAHGCNFRGKPTGSWGDVSGVSFYPGKNLGALGDGGMLVTDHDYIAERASILRNYGSKKKYFNEEAGYNMRLDEMQAAFLQIKLKYLVEWTKERQQIARWYNEFLQNIPQVTLPYVHPEAGHVYHLFVICVQKRNKLQAYLEKCGIGTLIHYPVPPHLQPAYKHLAYSKGSFPITEEIADTCLSLPLWVGMTVDEVDLVSSSIRTFYNCYA